MCIVSMMVSSVFLPMEVQASKKQLFEVNAEKSLSDITLKWEKQDGVSYYKVYRANYTNYITYGMSPREEEYKEISKLSNDKTEYVDKNVKKGIKYSYYIKGFEETNEEDKIVCTSFVDWDPLIVSAGLDTPEIRGAGYSKKKNRLKILIDSGYGLQPTGVDVYRKEVGKKNYKRIKVKKAGKNKVADEKAKRGKVYKYKVKTYIKIGEKKYYSKRSNILTSDTTNYGGRYKVKLLNNKGTATSTISFKVKSNNKYNANTFFNPGGALYFHRNSKKENQGRYDIKFTKYSLDNKTWKKIPKKGIVLKAKKTVYLQCEVYEDNLKDLAIINFGDGKPYESYIFFGESEFGDAIEYKNSKFYAEGTFDFVTGKGNAHQEGD